MALKLILKCPIESIQKINKNGQNLLHIFWKNSNKANEI